MKARLLRIWVRWHNRIPIRVRLALWYLLSFGLILLAFSSFLENQIRAGLEERADTALKLAANRMIGFVREDENGELSFQDIDAPDIHSDFSVYLFTLDGRILGHFGTDNIPIIETSREAGIFTIEARWREGRGKHNDVRVYNYPILDVDGGQLGILQVTQDFDQHRTLEMLHAHFCWGMPFAMMLAGIGGIWFASRALRPIDTVTRTAQAINASDLTQRLNYQGPSDEVGRLATTFDSMLDRLQAGFERERRFTGDAAHELRTPLTALKGQIGVALSQPRTPGEYAATLQDMEQQVNRLIRLSSDLLFMARLDYRQQADQPEQINLSDLLAVLEDQISCLAENKTITLASHVQPDLTVTGSMDLLIRLFLNLLDNAIKYSAEGGTVTIQAQRAVDYIQVAVSDTGSGIPADLIPHVFERFFRVEQDRARRSSSEGGTGLGLAIAQEIAHLHGGYISVTTAPDQGSTFTAHLPE